MPDTERETEVIVGTVDSIIQKGQDKWQAIVKTPEAAQFGRKCWTKSPDVHALLTSLLNQTVTLECGVSHYTLPDGKPTSSLWINAINPGSPPPQEPPGAVEAVAAAAQETPPEDAGAPVSASQPSQAPRVSDPTRTSIERQTAVKAAVEFNAALPEDLRSVEAVIAAARRFVSFIETGDDTPLPF